jgi:hypothetical protein
LIDELELKHFPLEHIINYQEIRNIKIMSFSTKIALIVVATGAIFSPIAALADTGSTAAAVSIKFNKHSDTQGQFSITPGGNASGGGTGISELSAAVATGETSAIANSASSKNGTTANANGWSAPVTFGYEAATLHTTNQNAYEYTSASAYQQEAAIAFAANQNKYQSDSSQSSKTLNVEKYKKSLTVATTGQTANESASGNSSNASLNVSGKASATHNAAGKGSSSATVNSTNTAYTYTGSSAGLKFLPLAK